MILNYYFFHSFLTCKEHYIITYNIKFLLGTLEDQFYAYFFFYLLFI